MDITLNSFRQNDDDITVFFTLDDGAETFRWHADIPIMDESEIQGHIEDNAETYRAGIYRKQYLNAQLPEGTESELDKWRSWEASGCKNADGTVIEKKPWKDTHTGQ